MIEFKLKATRSTFEDLLYCAANINHYADMNWVHRPERCDASFNVGSTHGVLVVWKGGKNIDLTIYGSQQGDGVHWDIELTDYAIHV